MDTVYKILENCEVKKVGERQYEFIASTADQDRDGEVDICEKCMAEDPKWQWRLSHGYDL